MKKMEVIIREEKLEPLKKSLEELGYFGMTISEVGGRGRQNGIALKWGTRDFRVDLLPKLKIEVVILDEDLPRVTNAIIRSTRTGEIGDGKIFIIPVEDAIRIRTGDSGDNAI